MLNMQSLPLAVYLLLSASGLAGESLHHRRGARA